MDKRDELIMDLVSILKRVKDCDINDPDMNLFGSEYDYTSGEMLDVFMDLRKKYNINLNSLIHGIEDYTVNNVADVLCKNMVADD